MDIYAIARRLLHVPPARSTRDAGLTSCDRDRCTCGQGPAHAARPSAAMQRYAQIGLPRPGRRGRRVGGWSARVRQLRYPFLRGRIYFERPGSVRDWAPFPSAPFTVQAERAVDLALPAGRGPQQPTGGVHRIKRRQWRRPLGLSRRRGSRDRGPTARVTGVSGTGAGAAAKVRRRRTAPPPAPPRAGADGTAPAPTDAWPTLARPDPRWVGWQP